MPALDPRRYGFALPAGATVREDFVSEVLPELVATGKLDTRGIMDFADGTESGEGKTIEQVATRLADVYCAGGEFRDQGYSFRAHLVLDCPT